MEYFMNITYLSLAGHVQLQEYRYVYFISTLSIYIFIICCNTVVIYVIVKNKRLHEPMYIFIAALLLNSLFGAVALYPKLLIDLLSEHQVISYQACMLQAFCIYSYATVEFAVLSTMAFDRYVSICKPLQYATLVNMHTVKKILLFSWFVPFCVNSTLMILTCRLQLCKLKMNRIYCNNYSIVKLSCGDITVNNSYGLFLLAIVVFPSLFFIVFSYIRILSVCLRNSKDFKRKAVQTCLTHILVVIIFSVLSCFEIINNRLEANISHIMTMIISVINLVIPPICNPIIYGIRMQEILNGIKSIMRKRKMSISF